MDNLQQMYNQWKAAPGQKTLTPLLTELNPTIDTALKAHGLSSDPNMRTSAQLHIIDSLPKFDPSKSQLKTFVTNELRRMQRVGFKQRFALPIPEQAASDLRSIQRYEKELKYELGRDPTDEELADTTGLSTKRIQTVAAKYGAPTVSELAFTTSEGDIAVPGTEKSLDPSELWIDAVYSGLDPIDKKIVDWSLGRSGRGVITKTEMARRLRMSVPAITQRSQRIADKLEEGSKHRIL